MSSAEQDELFARIVSRCRRQANEPVPVVVFDLDGTLMDNRPRTAVILKEFAAELRAEAHGRSEVVIDIHGAADRLSSARAESLAYLVTESLMRLGVEHPELVDRITTYWRTRFFTDAYLKHDIAVPGSVELARACYEAGATLVYFTGRDLPGMAVGSFQSLRDLGFPIGVVGTELVCKPEASQPDEAFKREEGPKIARIGRIVAAFDNEPGNCNAFLEIRPDSDVVFVDTQHLPGAPPLSSKVHIVGDLVMTGRPSR
jgi:phosphoglycolate phosphatase-like HAD superfamily hydrolase